LKKKSENFEKKSENFEKKTENFEKKLDFFERKNEISEKSSKMSQNRKTHFFQKIIFSKIYFFQNDITFCSDELEKMFGPYGRCKIVRAFDCAWFQNDLEPLGVQNNCFFRSVTLCPPIQDSGGGGAPPK